MIDQLQHQLEISGSAATLYLAGALRAHDAPRVRAICAGLPATVCTLRVDLHAMTAPAPDAVSALRGVLHEWRARRQGEFRLSLCTSHLAPRGDLSRGDGRIATLDVRRGGRLA